MSGGAAALAAGCVCFWMACLYEGFARSWIAFVEFLVSNKVKVGAVTECLTRSNALQDLERTGFELEAMEKQIEDRIKEVSAAAKQRAVAKDKSGAMKKLYEKRTLEKQLEKLRGSQHVINMHIGAIQGAELTQTLVTTLKASSHAMRSLTPHGDVKDVEDVVFDLEEELKKASEINDVLAKPMSRGMGPQLSESGYGPDDIEAELEDLLNDSAPQTATATTAPSKPNHITIDDSAPTLPIIPATRLAHRRSDSWASQDYGWDEDWKETTARRKPKSILKVADQAASVDQARELSAS